LIGIMAALPKRHPWLARADAFAKAHAMEVPILLAPMAGACPVALSVAVAGAGSMGALGALMLEPDGIARWLADYRAKVQGPLQINLWVPDPLPARDLVREEAVRAFLARFGPHVSASAGDARPPEFAAQCEALLAARPHAVSSIMGLFPDAFVARCKSAGIRWFATVTSVAEARAAAAAGADVIVAQGSEAGGHRGAFEANLARERAVGLFALLPQVVDAVDVPVVATGGIADARGIAAALALGANAVQLGTAFLRTPEAGIAAAWAQALAGLAPEDTTLTRAFSGRWGRAIDTDYVRAWRAAEAPEPAPYPVQRGLTTIMRKAAEQAGDVQRMQAWAGQGAALARAEPAADLVIRLWRETLTCIEAGAVT
jgi:nitronate monooxygenase